MLYLIQRETQTTLLAALFKVLILLISATPYARMPKDLFPTVIAAVCSRLLDRHSNKTEHYALLVNVLNCLEAAFSKVPPSSDVFGVIVQDGCAGPRQSYVSKCMRSHSIEKRSTELDAVEEENEMKDENQNKEPLVLTKLSLRKLRAKLKETLIAHEEPLVSTKLSLRKLRAKLKETLIAHEGKEAKRVALARLDNKSAIILTRRNS